MQIRVLRTTKKKNRLGKEMALTEAERDSLTTLQAIPEDYRTIIVSIMSNVTVQHTRQVLPRKLRQLAFTLDAET